MSALADCPASVDAVLKSADPAPTGATLHFSVTVGSGTRSATEFGGGLNLRNKTVQYDIETTVQTSTGNVGPSEQQFQAPLSDGQAEETIDVPVSSTSGTRDQLIGWRVTGVSCIAGAGTSSLSANCSDLLDYRDHELADEQLVLIKKYGIYAQGSGMIQDIRQQLIEDVKDGVGEHQQLLIKVKTVTDLVSGVYSILVPEGGAATAAAHVTADWVYQRITNFGDGVSVFQSATKNDLTSIGVTLVPNLNPVVAAGKTLYGFAQNMKDLNDQLELREMFETQLTLLDSQMAAYDAAMQKAFSQANALNEVRKGITMACGTTP